MSQEYIFANKKQEAALKALGIKSAKELKENFTDIRNTFENNR